MMRIAIPGLVLSAAAFALLGVLLFDVYRRRGRFPPLTYGGRTLRQGALGWLWAALLVVPFVVSLEAGAPVAAHTTHRSEPAPALDDGRASWNVNIGLPFIHYAIVQTRGVDDPSGAGVGTVGTRTVVAELRIPVLFLLAAAFYWLVVLRWPGTREEEPLAAGVGDAERVGAPGT